MKQITHGSPRLSEMKLKPLPTKEECPCENEKCKYPLCHANKEGKKT